MSGIVKALNPDTQSKRDAGLLIIVMEANGVENGGRGSVAVTDALSF